MTVLLRLKRHVELPTLWLSKREWYARFNRDQAAFRRALDGSPATVLEDLGGFARIVEWGRWWEPGPKRCTHCGLEKPLSEFHVSQRAIRSECKACARKAGRAKARELLLR